ncbi:hypothetical protein B0H14DRAFT_2624183 [Mycena olivaceomarginata]|nr:hypothetical protein B0H14DRAFT_2624183 [Mycena olivaceomarginata]
MSTPDQSIEAIIPFAFFNAPNDSTVGTNTLLDGTGNIDFNLPPYCLTNADVALTPGRPLLMVSPNERSPSQIQPDTNSWSPFHFLSHPAVYRSLHASRAWTPHYLASILDHAVPVFETIQCSHVFILHSQAQLIVLAGLLRLVSAVAQIVPARIQSGWTAFLPSNEPATSPTWDTYSPLSSVWLFPGTEEFPMDQPLHDPLSVADHSTLLQIARPNLRVLVHFMARDRIRETNGPRMANRALGPSFVIPCLPHKDLSSEPYPVIDMADYDSMWYWWQHLQDEHPSVVAARDWTFCGWVHELQHLLVAIQLSMGLFLDEISPEDARAITEAIQADKPAPTLCHRPAHSTVQGRKTTRGKAPPSTSAANVDSQGRPMIYVQSSHKSSTPPANEAYNEEGKEEKEIEEDEGVTLPKKQKCTGSRTPKTQGKGKARARSPAPPYHFPPTVRKTRGKSKKDELPAYVPPHPVPTTDSVRLASESITKEQSEPTVVSGNELITDLSAAHADYELAWEQLFCASACLAIASNCVSDWIHQTVASLGPDGLPGVADLLEELHPLWAQLLLDSQAELSVDYRAAVLRYLFISDTHLSNVPTDEDLLVLIDFLSHHPARAQQSTPLPEESSNWLEEDEAGPSGLK